MEIEAATGALGALAQEDRLRAFRLLVRAGPGGLPAGEIARRLDVRGPTLTFHLGQLVEAGLLSRRAAGRRRLYAVRPGAVHDLFAFLLEDCCQGRKDLCGAPLPDRWRRLRGAAPRPTVLFLCTRNAARSQMAEALLRHHAGDRYEAMSAGMRPERVHPLTRRVLREIGVDAAGLHAKDLGGLLGRVGIHHAIVVCDRARQDCARVQPFARHRTYWPIGDPAADAPGPRLEAFRETRDAIRARVLDWIARQEGIP